jgi:hypothetical protein
MSIVQQFHAAAAGARNFAALEEISRTLWQAHAAGALSDDAAQAAAEALQARKVALAGRASQPAQKRIGGAPRRSRPRSPDRERSISRRRSVAASGAVPSKIAASFTLGETAALSVIAREVQRIGSCEWPIDKIAAMAGVCRSTVQNALRAARRLDLVHVQERPRPGRKHLPNIISITSPDWKSWLRLDDRVQKLKHHEKHYLTYEQNNALIRDKRGRTLASCDNMLISHQNDAESQPCRPRSRLTA